MVQTIPGCPGSSAEFWGKNYWRYIKGKEVDVGKNLKKLNLTTNVAPHYFYDYCYVFEWIDRYQQGIQNEFNFTDHITIFTREKFFIGKNA